MRRLLNELSSSPLFGVLSTRKGRVPEIVPLLNLRARQRSALFIPPQFEPKEKNADRSKKKQKGEGESGKIIDSLLRVVWLKRNTKIKLYYREKNRSDALRAHRLTVNDTVHEYSQKKFMRRCWLTQPI